MLALFNRKSSSDPRQDRQVNRDSRQKSEGVLYGAQNKDRGVKFSYSGPAGSRHADEALKIAGRIYSNVDDESRVPKERKRYIKGDQVIDVEERVPKAVSANRLSKGVQPVGEIVAPRRLSKKKARSAERIDAAHAARTQTDGDKASRLSRHLITIVDSDDEGSVISASSRAPSIISQTVAPARHTVVPSEISVTSTTNANVTTNRHGVPISGKGFKHESGTQLTYGLQEGGRRLFASAPKDSLEAGVFRQVAEKMTGSNQPTLHDGGRHKKQSFLA